MIYSVLLEAIVSLIIRESGCKRWDSSAENYESWFEREVGRNVLKVTVDAYVGTDYRDHLQILLSTHVPIQFVNCVEEQTSESWINKIRALAIYATEQDVHNSLSEYYTTSSPTIDHSLGILPETTCRQVWFLEPRPVFTFRAKPELGMGLGKAAQEIQISLLASSYLVIEGEYVSGGDYARELVDLVAPPECLQARRAVLAASSTSHWRREVLKDRGLFLESYGSALQMLALCIKQEVIRVVDYGNIENKALLPNV